MTIATKLITLFEPILAPILAAVRRIEEFLGPEDDWVEEDRRILYEAADKFLRPLGRSTVTKKTDADYITTVELSPDKVETILHDNGYERNLLSTRKYRVHHNGGKQWAVGSWVLDSDDTDWQHHVFIFHSTESGTDVYAHKEPSVRDPDAHHKSDDIEYGNPMNLYEIFEKEGINYE